MRLLVLLAVLPCSALLPGCPQTCLEVRGCDRPSTVIEVPLTESNARILGARIEVCHETRCDSTFVEGPPTGRADEILRCAPPRVGSLSCSRKDGISPIVVSWSGAFGGAITVRVTKRTASGGEEPIAERTGTMVREEYVAADGCGGELTCSQWVMR